MFDISRLSALIFDLDGVIWRGNMPVPGAVESVARLRAAGKRCFYCTNNSRKAPADFVAALAGMGIEAEEEEIMTSSSATALYLSQQLTGDFSAYVVGEDGLTAALRKVGARIVSDREAESNGDNWSDFPVDCVVAGIDRHFTYDKLRLAQRFILNGARFVATNRDSTFPVANGVVPGAGSIVSAIETASGISPVTIGKPQPLMMHLLLQKFSLAPDETAMIGDRLDTDIIAAHRAGIGALYVATGVNTLEEAQRARGDLKPDVLLDDLPALCTLLGLDATVVASTQAPKNEAESLKESAPQHAENTGVETATSETTTSEATTAQSKSQSSASTQGTGEAGAASDNWWESMDGMFSDNGRAKPPEQETP
ncbi:MAG TPA: phosphoglycolate/pyridoxal phosphate family phosphatase [Abditibacteriaceae bacterium]|jgi:4-nitrophenyl phosphatase